NEVREITEKWLSEYNCERPHESLNNMTPEEYRQHHYLECPRARRQICPIV
ncbi:transposase, partial [Salmonella enterica]|nr:transposase [Salmonella enterica]